MKYKHENLDFRRQFLITKENIKNINESWRTEKLNDNYFLKVHKDLSYYSFGNSKKKLTLIGYVLNPYKPSFSNKKIIEELFHKSTSFNDLLKYSALLSGRWILIFELNSEMRIFSDPSSSRTLYFYRDASNPVIGSHPTIINYVVNDKQRKDKFQQYYMSSKYYLENEYAWFGNKTIYENIFKLLPNHYLSLESMSMNRFWVNLNEQFNLNDVIKESSKILKGTIQAINYRTKTMLAVTAGIDSRILLAASKEYKNDIYYFVDAPNNNLNHPDVRIPSKLAKNNNFELNIHIDIPVAPSKFREKINYNIGLSRELSKTDNIYYYHENFQEFVLISGNASGIAKNVYGKKPLHNFYVDADYIMSNVGIPKEYIYVRDELEEWLDNIKSDKIYNNINIFDLLYWEQRMGNWGELYSSELDIAMENLMPFNNRRLILILPSTKYKYRKEPSFILYRRIIDKLWPNLLNEPINPTSKIKTIVKKGFYKLPRYLKVKLSFLLNHYTRK